MPLPLSPQRVRSIVVLAIVLVAASAALFATRHADAQSSVLSARQHVGVSAAAVFEAKAERRRLEADVRDLERRRARLWRQISARLDTMYRNGEGHSISVVLMSGGSVTERLDAAATATEIAEHDRRALQRWADMHRRTAVMRERVESATVRIDRAQRALRRARAKLAAEQRRQRAARAAAARLARQPESPLSSPTLSPESVKVRTAEASEPAPSAPGYTETGIASVYADDFKGEKTASGEPYDPGAMTAAHRTLPLGTWVHVKGPGGSAMVRINDRGPYIGGRIIDLSAAAAQAVGVQGLGTVTITVQQ